MIYLSLLEVRHIQGSTRHGPIGQDLPVTFRLNQGEIGILLGGKKPLQVIELIMAKGQLAQGDIKIFGQSIKDKKGRLRFEWHQDIGYAFSKKGLLSNLSIFNNVDLPAKYHGFYDGKRYAGEYAERALDELEISKKHWNKLPSQVSDEVYKKATLARAAVLDPKVLILDEPSAMIRWPTFPKILDWIRLKRDQGTSFLIGTEMFPFGMAIADWALMPDLTEVDYNFRENRDNSWVDVADILARGMHQHENIA